MVHARSAVSCPLIGGGFQGGKHMSIMTVHMESAMHSTFKLLCMDRTISGHEANPSLPMVAVVPVQPTTSPRHPQDKHHLLQVADAFSANERLTRRKSCVCQVAKYDMVGTSIMVSRIFNSGCYFCYGNIYSTIWLAAPPVGICVQGCSQVGGEPCPELVGQLGEGHGTSVGRAIGRCGLSGWSIFPRVKHGIDMPTIKERNKGNPGKDKRGDFRNVKTIAIKASTFRSIVVYCFGWRIWCRGE